MQRHPENMRNLDKSSFLAMAEDIEKLYGGFLYTFIAEATTPTWFEMFKTDEASDVALNESLVEYTDLIAQATPFHLVVCEAIKIGLTIPTTTYSIECTFSTSSICQDLESVNDARREAKRPVLLSVHRKRVVGDEQIWTAT